MFVGGPKVSVDRFSCMAIIIPGNALDMTVLAMTGGVLRSFICDGFGHDSA